VPDPEPLYRTWGDGALKNRQHIIKDISVREGWVLCDDGTRVEQGRWPSLEDAWDNHRGYVTAGRRAIRRVQEQASDTEVRAFLRGIDRWGIVGNDDPVESEVEVWADASVAD
jgi:hypothetical protein